MKIYWLLMPLLLLFTLWGTGRFIRSERANQLMDQPNARSSHTTPTPRGGGVVFVASFLSCLPLLYFNDLLASGPLLSLMLGGFSLAWIGFLDDHGHVPVRIRLAIQFVASALGLWLLAPSWPPAAPLLPELIPPQGWTVLYFVVCAFFWVWLINLYNFMDGIDGLAALETISVLLGGALLGICTTSASNWELPVLLACATGGFLMWNFPPARVFMGDSGSNFLGYCLGVFILLSAQIDPLLAGGWLILLAVFVVDATFTLMRRLLSGQVFYQAHRSHAYQWCARRWGHRQVTLSITCINLIWLLPLALLAVTHQITFSVAFAGAYLPLILLAWHFKAGQAETTP